MDGGGRLQRAVDGARHPLPLLRRGDRVHEGAPQDVVEAERHPQSTGRAYFGDHLTEERIAETQAHPLYQHIKRLNQIRRAVPALQKGAMRDVHEWGSGMGFIRDWNDGES